MPGLIPTNLDTDNGAWGPVSGYDAGPKFPTAHLGKRMDLPHDRLMVQTSTLLTNPSGSMADASWKPATNAPTPNYDHHPQHYTRPSHYVGYYWINDKAVIDGRPPPPPAPQSPPPPPPPDDSYIKPDFHAKKEPRTQAVKSPNGLPPVPGLPQRPSFDTPDLSHEEMARIHAGQKAPPIPVMPQQYLPPPNDYYNLPNPISYQHGDFPPYQTSYKSSHVGSQPQHNTAIPPHHNASDHDDTTGDINLSAEINALIADGKAAAELSSKKAMQKKAGERITTPEPVESAASKAARGVIAQEPYEEPVPVERPAASGVIAQEPLEEPEPVERPATSKAEQKATKTKDKDGGLKLLYSDNTSTPEEKMAKLAKYQRSVSEKKTETILTQAGDETQAVAGPVDDAMEAS